MGFRIGYHEEAGSPTSRPHRNLRSAYLNPSSVSEYIEAESRAGRLRGPFVAHDSCGEATDINVLNCEPLYYVCGNVACDI